LKLVFDLATLEECKAELIAPDTDTSCGISFPYTLTGITGESIQATYQAFSAGILSEVIVAEGFVDGCKHGEFLIERDVVHRVCVHPQNVSHVPRRRIYRPGKLAVNRQFAYRCIENGCLTKPLMKLLCKDH